MYLIICEDGYLVTKFNLTEEDYNSCNNGIISIVSIGNCDNVEEYVSGEWLPVDHNI